MTNISTALTVACLVTAGSVSRTANADEAERVAPLDFDASLNFMLFAPQEADSAPLDATAPAGDRVAAA